MDSTSPWRAANGTYLISMFGRISVELKTVEICRCGLQGAAEALCFVCLWAAVLCLVCSSDMAELGHMLGVHGKGPVRSCLHACCDVLVRWCGMYRVSRGTRWYMLGQK